jgi:hypothetical protein
MIKLVVCDGDGTLELPTPSQKILTLLKKMEELHISLAVATNSTHAAIQSAFKKAGLPLPAIIVTPQDVGGVVKPSPKFIEFIGEQTGIQRNEMVYLGDRDDTDIYCAGNARILPFASLYSTSGKPRYGLPVDDPLAFMKYLETYGSQTHPFFGWSIKDPNQNLEMYALIGEHGDMGLTSHLKMLFKQKKDVLIGPKENPLGGILFHYFLSQSYLSGLIQDIDYVAVYPGHEKDSENKILSVYLDILQKTIGRRYLPGLITRHTTTVASHTLGSNRNIHQQFATIQLNKTYQKRIQRRRILVLDDFTTNGYSLETARTMLLKGGAESVVGMAFAKYKMSHAIVTISDDWNPFAPCSLQSNQISVTEKTGQKNQLADQFFANIIWKAAQE